MAVLKPFRAVRYDGRRVRLGAVTAPPYDVISKREQDALYRRSPYNIVRLILGKEKRGDNARANRYTRAAQFLRRWIRRRIFVQDRREAFYLYEQVFRVPETSLYKRRLVFFALVRLEPFGKGSVYPHERTHAGPKRDRLRLMKQVEANLSPVFGLYEDRARSIRTPLSHWAKRRPLYDFLDSRQVRHRLWPITNPRLIGKIQQAFRGKKVFIADGHHRYETALTYRDWLRARRKNCRPEEPFDYVMVGLCDLEDSGLIILPIHRIVKGLRSFRADVFLKSLSRFFELRSVSPGRLKQILAAPSREKHQFGLYLGRRNAYVLRPKRTVKARNGMPAGKFSEWYELDTNWVSFLIIQGILQLTDRQLEEHCVYTPFAKEAMSLVDRRQAQFAILVHPTRLESVKRMCTHNERMPQKSTFFYPKLWSGLVLYPHVATA